MPMLQLAPHTTRVDESRTGDERSLRREIVRWSHALARQQCAPGTAGNISARLGTDRILVTPTGRSKSSLRAPDLVTVDMAGCRLAGAAAPSSELAMHLEIYRRRPDVAAVIHAHPPIATAFACSGRALDRVLCQEAAMTLGAVPLAAYATTGTAEVAANLVRHLEHHDAILLANHGVVTYSSSIERAFHNLETLEHLAQVHLVAHQLGSPVYLGAEQLEALKQARLHYLAPKTAEVK